MPPPKQILACTPTDANARLAAWGSSERYSPGIDYTMTRCEECGTDMWIGPNQKAAYDAAPVLFVRLCAVCAVLAAPGANVVRLAAVDSPRRLS